MRRRMPAGPPGTVARRGATRRTSSSLAKFVTTVPVRLDPGGLVPSSKFRRVRAHTRPAFFKTPREKYAALHAPQSRDEHRRPCPGRGVLRRLADRRAYRAQDLVLVPRRSQFD